MTVAEKKPYLKNYKDWHDRVPEINSYIFNDYFYEKEVWWCSLGINIGSEQDGKHSSFERPVLILKKINKDLLWVVPLSTKISTNYYRINTRSTGQESQVTISQIRAISSKRLLRKISQIDMTEFVIIIFRIILTLIAPT